MIEAKGKERDFPNLRGAVIAYEEVNRELSSRDMQNPDVYFAEYEVVYQLAAGGKSEEQIRRILSYGGGQVGQGLTKTQFMQAVAAGRYAFENKKGVSRSTDDTSTTNIPLSEKNTYPYNVQTVIQDYLEAVDNDLLAFISDHSNKDNNKFSRQKISDVSAKQASDIQRITNIDVEGYTNDINSNAIRHIQKRHGKDGTADSSMSNEKDLARVGYIINNYDDLSLVEDGLDGVYSKEFRNAEDKPAPMIRYQKKINGTYYVVQAIPESKHKKLWVVSAYIQKNKAVTQVLTTDTKNLGGMSLASPASTNSIPQNSEKSRAEEEKEWRSSRRVGHVYYNGAQSVEVKGRSLYLPASGLKKGGRGFKDGRKLNADQKAAVYFAENVVAKMGIDVVFYSSAQNRTLPNGIYRGNYFDGGVIYLDIEAGMDEGVGESLVVYALAHELTHAAERLSPELYEKYSDAVLRVLCEKEGLSLEALITRRQNEHLAARLASLKKTYYGESEEQIAARLEAEGGLDIDGAVRELVADASQLIMTRGSGFAEALAARLEKKEPGLWDKIVAAIQKAIARLRELVLSLPEDDVSRHLVDYLDELAPYFNDMMADTLYQAGNNRFTDDSYWAELIARGEAQAKELREKAAKLQYRRTLKNGVREYTTDFGEDVSREEKVKLFRERIASVFNLGMVKLNVDTKKIQVLGDRFTAQKTMFGDEMASENEKLAKLNALYDLADMLQTSTYLPNKTQKEASYADPSKSPKNQAHKGVKYWYKFQNDIILDGTPYTVIFNIRDKGKEQYQYLIEFHEKKTLNPSHTVTNAPPTNRLSASNSSISQNSDLSTPESEKFSGDGQMQERRRNDVYSAEIMKEDVDVIHQIGARKSINDFNSGEIAKTEKWARKFYSELGVKSPYFRAWFGDWRAYDRSKIKTVTVENIDLADVVMQTGAYTNPDTGWNIHAGATLRDETKHYARGEKVSVKALNDVKNIFEAAVLLDTEISVPNSKNKKPGTAFMHKLYAPINYQGKLYIAKLTVEEFFDKGANSIKRKGYHLSAIKIEAADEGFADYSTDTLRSITASMDSIADLHGLVKQYDKDFSPKPVNSILLNEDGTPKVFYHGTGERFSVFDPAQMREREGSFFFAENREDAAGYGQNIYEVYLQADNLADYDNQPSEFYQLRNKRKQVEWLKERGYDGWYADMDSDGWGEISVFKNTQIKSATDNIGTFNRENPDIQYQYRRTTHSDREVLVRALDKIVPGSDVDAAILEDYRKNLASYREMQRELETLDSEMKTIYDKGSDSYIGYKDSQRLDALNKRRTKLTKTLRNADMRLLGIESLTPFRNLILQARKEVRRAERANEKLKQKHEEKEKTRVQKAEARKLRIQYLTRAERAINRLYRWTMRPNKKEHIPTKFMPYVKRLFEVAFEGKKMSDKFLTICEGSG